MKLIKKFISKYNYIILMSLSFILLDIVLRYFTRSINFYKIYFLVPNLFTLIWTFLMVGICSSLNKKVGKFMYIFFISISIILFLTHSIYYAYFKNCREFF